MKNKMNEVNMVEELVLFCGGAHYELIREGAFLIECCENGLAREKWSRRAYAFLSDLIEEADIHGLKGNLWHGLIALFIADHENAFSRACEIQGTVAGSINKIALHDFFILKSLMDFEISRLGYGLATVLFSEVEDYQGAHIKGNVFDNDVRQRLHSLAADLSKAQGAEAFLNRVASFYQCTGAGKFGLHRAFRILRHESEVVVDPITNVENIRLGDLVGYERQKKKLLDNTEAFIKGKAANNVLLFGDSGTGKSSSIKAILNEYYDQGLRMIEVYKHQFQDLTDIIGQIKDRNYKFIIYMDDLSFEDHELEYKYLKAIIEGGLGIKPANVLIYATSNRRHLIREKFSDKRDLSDDLHKNDTVQEKLSLAARFGVTIYYGSPDKKEFKKIVSVLADRYNLHIEEEKLYELANQWELTHGGLSGRTAAQFITHLLGKGMPED